MFTWYISERNIHVTESQAMLAGVLPLFVDQLNIKTRTIAITATPSQKFLFFKNEKFIRVSFTKIDSRVTKVLERKL